LLVSLSIKSTTGGISSAHGHEVEAGDQTMRAQRIDGTSQQGYREAQHLKPPSRHKAERPTKIASLCRDRFENRATATAAFQKKFEHWTDEIEF